MIPCKNKIQITSIIVRTWSAIMRGKAKCAPVIFAACHLYPACFLDITETNIAWRLPLRRESFPAKSRRPDKDVPLPLMRSQKAPARRNSRWSQPLRPVLRLAISTLTTTTTTTPLASVIRIGYDALACDTQVKARDKK